MIVLKSISKHYQVDGQLIKAVDGVGLTVEKGEMVSIVGHSGSGKSTLLSLIGGLTRPNAGSVEIDGTDLWSISDYELSRFRNRKMNFIYQFASLIPTLTAVENVMLPTVFGKTSGDDAEGRAGELLGLVGLHDKIRSYPSQLSGGQQRRVAIARAFINNPEVILADEPTGDLDEQTEAEVFELFNRINAEKRITFIIVTHSRDLAGKTRRQLRMERGMLKEN